MFDVSLYNAAVLVHVAAASVLLGSSIVSPLIRRSMLAADTLSGVRTWLEFHRRMARADPHAAFVLLATGIYLGSAGWWSQPWFYVAAATWVACSIIAAALLQGGATRLSAALGSRDGAIDRAVDEARRARAWDLGHELLRAFNYSMLYVMFQKPGLVECVLVIGAAVGLSVALGRRQAVAATQPRRPAIANSPEAV